MSTSRENALSHASRPDTRLDEAQHPRRHPLDERRAPLLFRDGGGDARARADLLGVRDPRLPQRRRGRHARSPPPSCGRRCGLLCGRAASASTSCATPRIAAAPSAGRSASRSCRSPRSSPSSSRRRPGSRSSPCCFLREDLTVGRIVAVGFGFLGVLVDSAAGRRQPRREKPHRPRRSGRLRRHRHRHEGPDPHRERLRDPVLHEPDAVRPELRRRRARLLAQARAGPRGAARGDLPRRTVLASLPHQRLPLRRRDDGDAPRLPARAAHRSRRLAALWRAARPLRARSAARSSSSGSSSISAPRRGRRRHELVAAAGCRARGRLRVAAPRRASGLPPVRLCRHRQDHPRPPHRGGRRRRGRVRRLYRQGRARHAQQGLRATPRRSTR